MLTAALAVLAGTQTSTIQLVAAAFVLGLGAGLATQTSSTVVTQGIPPDELDTSLPETDSAPSPFTGEDELRTGPIQAGSAHGVQVLFWPRAEVPEAHRRFPEMVEHADAETVCRDRERANHELAEAGYPRITLVPLRVAALAEFAEATGSDPREEGGKAACMAEAVARGEAIRWPPGRNGLCWCGSGRKYKKCCGRPTLD